MPPMIGDEFLKLLLDRELIPATAISVTIELKWGDVPRMVVETLPDSDEIFYIISCIKRTDLIVSFTAAT